MKKRLLWLDDSRNPLENDWLVFSPIGRNVDVSWVTSYDEFVNWITNNGLPDGISFDHDLGDVTDIGEKTGYDCAKFLVDYCIEHKDNLPEYAIQSSNPAGRENIDMLLKNYKKFVA